MEQAFLVKILLMLVIAIASIAWFRRLGLPAILAYLLTGMLSGPGGFDWFSQQQMQSVAELGVVLLMFTLGLEFSLPRLLAMRRTVFGLGSAQVIVTSSVVVLVSLALGLSLVEAMIIGAVIALSSTAIVLKLLNEQGWLRRRHGELSVSVLLFQDLAVIPLLILLPLMGSESQAANHSEIFIALVKGIVAFVALMAFGRWALPKLFDEVARSRSNELFVLTTLVVATLTGVFTHWLGLSMALGAFMAGMLLGESQYRRQLEADISPFRDLLMGLFFISIGMLLDLTLVVSFWWQVLVILLAVVVGKIAILFGILRLSGESTKIAATSAITLAQVGEFSFVVLALAVNYQLLSSEISTILVMVAVISMGLAPALIRHCGEIIGAFGGMGADVENHSVSPKVRQAQVLILGYGRVGQTVARFLRSEAVPYVVLDLDPTRVSEARIAGEPVLFGDACKRSLLLEAGLLDVNMLVISFCDGRALEEVLPLARELAPQLTILVRTRDDSNMTEFEQAGASQVIPESLEGSLMLVSQVLYRCGVPLTRILKRLESERRNHYHYLHGFFSGQESDFTLEQLHAVALPASAWAVGKRLSQVPVARLRIEIRAIRRSGAEVENPPSDWLLQADDILLLQGKPRRVERAEIFLLGG
ncbi:potassium transporter [Shewanella sp. SNU WT4]|uniref:monovalent cation:proton antiporter family protein n=1 Tax=Shewanella sp. SNU WT4 TaxID=2590015 RepID=UPI00112B087D|nr:monovalent cation:proton antiporter family protein [Shewanella sp. SNU WT4]QDF67753.1 potassium transporter [Shewanella sp. SNU WT4]